MAGWATAVRKLFTTADPWERRSGYRRLTAALRDLCTPLAGQAAAAARRLCKRIVRYEAERFTCVRDPAVSPDNNAAERSLRRLVTQRTINGGARSPRGATTAMTLATLFGTWRVRSLTPCSTAAPCSLPLNPEQLRCEGECRKVVLVSISAVASTGSALMPLRQCSGQASAELRQQLTPVRGRRLQKSGPPAVCGPPLPKGLRHGLRLCYTDGGHSPIAQW